MSIDYVGLHQNIVESSFQYATWHREICELTKLGGISQVWLETPAWYFWTKDTKGAFLFRMTDNETNENFSIGTYLLHYFPVDISEHKLFSKKECNMLLDKNKFDYRTSTPYYDYLEKYFSSFIVSELKFMITSDSEPQVLTYSFLKKHKKQTNSFINMFISVLNFYTKKKIIKYYTVSLSKSVITNMIIYNLKSFNIFSDIYDLKNLNFTNKCSDKDFAKWQLMSEKQAACTSQSTCSCGSH